ncbi:sulfatase family protein [Botrimarina hoheduenensis]|uniref:Arylsulfatase n=1 Tax=Botrimarina hoheduenensis TaxID=2528000 RepID=A0A5C5WCS5_9BACT|nr:arylsulfatase [Botrimarina hoheduenensis]TWT47839.1 Arylsulfatase [Botrimarina hoheduenensis]
MFQTLRLLALLGAAIAASIGAAEAPNIVLIYADDLGYGDVGCYGAKSIPTPNIDRLAAGGLRFTSGYCTSATCTPSRYSLLTGQYAWRTPGTGIAPPNGTALIKPGTPTLPQTLREAGYRTAVIGKWHLGLGAAPKPNWAGEIKPGPLEIGFDESFILPTTNDRVPCVYVRGHRIVGQDPDDPVDVFDTQPDDQPTGITQRDQLKMDWSHGHNETIVNGISRIGFMVGGVAARWIDETMAEIFVKEVDTFLDQGKAQPFFLFYSAHQTHVPRAPNAMFVGATPHGPRGDAIVELDWCVGKIVAQLEQRGMLENTLILFTSDNGPILDDGYRDQANELLGNHQPAGAFRGSKYSRFEAGTRVPWIVHWPAEVKAGVTDAMISQVDLFASFCALAGTNLAEGVATDSLDLSQALTGHRPAAREYVVEHSGLTAKLAVRRGDWKYIEPDDGPQVLTNTGAETANSFHPQLYNLSTDAGERKNVAGKHPQIVDQLANLLQQERRKTGRD